MSRRSQTFTTLASALRRFGRNQHGGLAMYAGLAIPVILGLAGGSLDIATAINQRERLTDIAQGAALVGAGDMQLAATSQMPLARSRAWAEQEMRAWSDAPDAVVSSSIVDIAGGQHGVRVDIAAHRTSIFGTILPPGGWHIDASAVAAPMGTSPLCVIATQRDRSEVMRLLDTSAVQAPGCLIHSNRDVLAENHARIEAGAVEAVTAIEGDVNPRGLTDAPAIADPFVNLDLTPPSGANEGNVTWDSGVHTLARGYHHQHITLRGTASLHLEPGEHWFVGADLRVRENARVDGDDVVLMFDRRAKFEFRDNATVRLSGRESGPFSGFVLVSTRDNDHDFVITSDHVEELLGVVYSPNARLVIEGGAQVARQSAWTVIVAKSIWLDGNPTLFLNANYRGADVPVPSGVGARGGTRLVQ